VVVDSESTRGPARENDLVCSGQPMTCLVLSRKVKKVEEVIRELGWVEEKKRAIREREIEREEEEEWTREDEKRWEESSKSGSTFETALKERKKCRVWLTLRSSRMAARLAFPLNHMSSPFDVLIGSGRYDENELPSQ
jgi:hypothetical protein